MPESREAARGIGAAGTTVKTGIAASLRGIDEIETEIVSLVRNTVSNSIRATGAVGTESGQHHQGRGERCPGGGTEDLRNRTGG